MAQKLRHAVKQAVADVEGAVHIQQKQPFVPQLGHGIVSFIQKIQHKDTTKRRGFQARYAWSSCSWRSSSLACCRTLRSCLVVSWVSSNRANISGRRTMVRL